jgi:hypothetical protein
MEVPGQVAPELGYLLVGLVVLLFDPHRQTTAIVMLAGAFLAGWAGFQAAMIYALLLYPLRMVAHTFIFRGDGV